MPKLTKKFVDAATPKAGQTDSVFFDDKLAGFGLRVKAKTDPATGLRSYVRSYVIQYRNRRGKSCRLTIGTVGRQTPDQARRQAKLKLADVERGHDPLHERRAERGAMTVRQLCTMYLAAAEKGLILGKGRRPKKESTIATDRGRIERHIVPLLGSKAVRDVTHVEVTGFMRHVIAGKTAADIKTKKRGRAIVEGGPGTAARTVGLLGGIFSYAISEGLRTDNPVSGVERPAYETRTRRLTHGEYAALGKALTEAEAEKENAAAIAAIRLLALTGARRGEIAKLKKTEVDREGHALRLADSKEGSSIRPLGAAAIRVLDAIPEALRRPSSPWVFPGNGDKIPYAGLPKAIKRIFERKPELAGVTAHTLRHSFASIAADDDDLGYSLVTVGALLGHGKGSVTSGYIHKLDSALIAAADAVATRIEEMMAGKAKQAEIRKTQADHTAKVTAPGSM